MKQLRNKKTGEIARFIGLCIEDGLYELAVRLNENDKKWDNFYYASLAELNAEWEDYGDDMFYIIRADGGVDSRYKTNDGYEENFKQIGNYFETKEEAEKAVEKLKAWKRLKDRGFKFCIYEGLGCGEIHFTSDWDIEDEYEKGQRRKDLDLLFGGEECLEI